jgi:hypothetical protein
MKNWIKSFLLTIGEYLVPTLIIVIFFLVATCIGDSTKNITRKVKRENTYGPKISNVQIFDTIFQSDVNQMMAFDSVKIKLLKKEIDSLRKKIPEIRKDKDEGRGESFFRMLRHKEGLLEDLKNQVNLYNNNLNIGVLDNDICGYIVYLEFNEHPTQSVMNTKYKLIGPPFLYEKDEK